MNLITKHFGPLVAVLPVTLTWHGDAMGLQLPVHSLENCWVEAKGGKICMPSDAVIVALGNNFSDPPTAHIFQWLWTGHTQPTLAPAYTSAHMRVSFVFDKQLVNTDVHHTTQGTRCQFKFSVCSTVWKMGHSLPHSNKRKVD